MVALTFDLNPGEKLDFTFDFTDELDGISATITGSPTVTIAALNAVLEPTPLLTQSGSPSVLSGNKKVSNLFITTATEYREYNVKCIVTANDASSRVFEQSMIICIRPSSPNAVDGATTVGRIINELGITDETKQKLLPDFIAEATEAIEAYIGYRLKKQSFTEKLAGSGRGNVLQVANNPIISIESISFDDVELDSETYRIHSAGAGTIWLDGGVADTEASSGNLSGTPAIGGGAKLYEVEYTAGYILPGNASRTLPRNIERAAIDLVRTYLNARSNPEIKSESIDGVGSVTYVERGLEGSVVPAGVAALLNPYRRLAI